jgi:uncharacterized membrane protein YdjX (TVP38/TMEM64 family)
MSTAATPSQRRQRIMVLSIAVVVVIVFAAITRFGGGEHWREAINRLPVVALLTCFALLPLSGFPVTLILLAVGARFGFGVGLAITAGAIVVHLSISYPLAERLRRPVTALLRRAGWTLPKLDHQTAWPFSLWLSLAPGLSYALKNYTSPLAGVPFRTYFFTYFPVHLCTSVIGLLLGGATTRFSWPLAFGVLAYAVGMGILSRRLASRLGKSGAFHAQAST